MIYSLEIAKILRGAYFSNMRLLTVVGDDQHNRHWFWKTSPAREILQNLHRRK
jgi:hypothetical protein